MRKTLTLTVDRDLAQFIDDQPGMIDPSAFINQLIHEDMQKKGYAGKPGSQEHHDAVVSELERWVDQSIPAGG